MSKNDDLSKLVIKEFQHLLSKNSLDMKMVHDSLDITYHKDAIIRLRKSKKNDGEKLFRNICELVVDCMEQYIDKYGGIVKAEVTHSVADYMNQQLGTNRYRPDMIKSELLTHPYFTALLAKRGIKSSQVRKIAKVDPNSAINYLEKRSIFYKNEIDAVKYIRKKAKIISIKEEHIKENQLQECTYEAPVEKPSEMKMDSDSDIERLKGTEYLLARVNQIGVSRRERNLGKGMNNDTCQDSQIVTILEDAGIKRTSKVLSGSLRQLLISQLPEDQDTQPFSISRASAFARLYSKDKKFRHIAQEYL